MSTAGFWIGHMLGESDIDSVLLQPDHGSLAQSSNLYESATTHALLDSLSGLPRGEKSFLNHFGGSLDDLYSFNTSYESPRPRLNSFIDKSSSPSTIDTQIVSSNVSPGDIAKEPNETSTRAKTNSSAKAPKRTRSTDKPTKTAPKSRRLQRHAATKAGKAPRQDHKPESVPTKKKTKNRRQVSLERNRVVASKCRSRKKQWTDNLEQKKSGLECMHHELQAEYMSLLQESSLLKSFLINHASCQDPNIDIWIKNEAAKFVQNLQKTHRSNSLYSLSSLDKIGSISSSASPLTDVALETPVLESRDLDMDDNLDNQEPSEDDQED